MTTAEQRVKELGLDLPPPPGAAGNYVAGVQTGNLLFLSGCGPRRADGSYVQTLNAAGVAVSSDGTWSGHGGNGLLLDPSSKSADDVSFEIVSNDELRTDKGTRVFKRVAGR